MEIKISNFLQPFFIVLSNGNEILVELAFVVSCEFQSSIPDLKLFIERSNFPESVFICFEVYFFCRSFVHRNDHKVL